MSDRSWKCSEDATLWAGHRDPGKEVISVSCESEFNGCGVDVTPSQAREIAAHLLKLADLAEGKEVGE